MTGRLLRRLCGPVFVLAGALHFVRPRWYEAIMPPYLPHHRELVYASGAAEIAGGLGLMVPRTRRPASWWLVATLVAVFPANVHMAMHPDQFPQVPGGRVALLIRLPFQGIFIAWVRVAARSSIGYS